MACVHQLPTTSLRSPEPWGLSLSPFHDLSLLAFRICWYWTRWVHTLGAFNFQLGYLTGLFFFKGKQTTTLSQSSSREYLFEVLETFRGDKGKNGKKMYHCVSGQAYFNISQSCGEKYSADIIMLSGGINVSTFTSPPTPTLHWGGGFEIRGTGCQNFSGVKQAIEWAKNTTSGRQPFSDRDTFLKRRPELIMHVVPLPKVPAAF